MLRDFDRQSNDSIEGIKCLEEKYNQLEEEQDTIVVEETFSENDKIKKRRNLIDKIFTNQHISKITIGGMMRNI